MDNDYEFDDGPCPSCGKEALRYRHCDQIGCDDGEIDMYEFDDPLWYSPGDTERCQDCGGTGIQRWCSACGWDNSGRKRINGSVA